MNPNHYLAVAIDYLYRHRRRLAGRRGGRQDAGQLVDDRPGRGGPRPHAARGAGRLQVVRARAAGRLGRLRRRGERRRVVPAARRLGVDHRQGRHHPVPAGLGDHRGDRASRRRALRATSPRGSATRRTRASTRRPPASRRRCSASCRRSRSRADELAGEPITAQADRGARQRRADRRAEGDHRVAAGSRRGRPAPRTSTSSTPSRSAGPSTWRRSRTRRAAIVASALG